MVKKLCASCAASEARERATVKTLAFILEKLDELQALLESMAHPKSEAPDIEAEELAVSEQWRQQRTLH